MKRITLAILWAFIALAQTAFSQESSKRISIDNNQVNINRLIEKGIDFHCGSKIENNNILMDLGPNEIKIIESLGISYTVKIDDLTSFYVERMQRTKNAAISTVNRIPDNISGVQQRSTASINLDNYLEYFGCDEINWTTPTNFDYYETGTGTPLTMGTSLRLDQVLSEMVEMNNLFPNQVSALLDASSAVPAQYVGQTDQGGQPEDPTVTWGNSFGSTTWSGQTIHYVRITGDQSSAEGSKPQILFTSMIHSREVGSLMSNIYFMWYLLENYATNDAVKNLVDNNELYFIPVVNPDGLRWNEVINPSGGGLQRKNLRPDANTGFNNRRGVDLNRNFDYLFGSAGSGSSGTASDDTYRGPYAFSEPESKILRNFVLSRDFQTVLMNHGFANSLPHPYGGIPGQVSEREDEMHKWHEDMTRYNRYVSGATIFSAANGIADDWMVGSPTTNPSDADGNGSFGSERNILATTPEHGDSGFWPPANDIIPIAERAMRLSLTSIYHGGRYAKFHDLTQSDISTTTSNLTFGIERVGQFNDNETNKTADFNLTITPVSSNIVSIANVPTQTLDILEQADVQSQIVLNASIQPNDKIEYRVQLSDSQGVVFYDVNIEKYYQPSVLLNDNPDNDGITNWNASGGWNIITNSGNPSNVYSGTTAIRDNNSTSYANGATKTLTTTSSYNLSGANEVLLQFYTKWDLERNYDFVEIQGSTNGTNWTSLCGKYTKPNSTSDTNGHREKTSSGSFQASNSDGLLYDGDRMDKWVMEEIVIDATNNSFLLGAGSAQFRFRFRSDNNNRFENYSAIGEGFYFDDFKIINTKPIPCDASNSPTNLTVSNIGGTSADVTWDAIPSATYDLRYRETGTSVWTNITDIIVTSQTLTGLDISTEYEVQVATRCNTTTSSFSASEVFTTIDPCINSISTYPYIEEFETGEGLWEQPTNDDGIWTRDANGTPSGPTGPNGGFDINNPATQEANNFYMYVEGTLGQNPGPNSTVFFESPCIDLTGRENGNFSFRYHMHGTDMGTLEVEASTDFGATWTTINTLSGQQHPNQTDPWLERNVSLIAYNNQVIKLRFKGTTPTFAGTNPPDAPFRTDMAIDYINITSDVAPLGPTVITQNISVNLDASGNATIAEDAVNNGSTGTGILTFDTDVTSFTCADIGANTVTLTVTDDNGSDSATATVTVVDNLAPVPDAMTLPDTTGECSATITGSAPTATDNCGGTITGTTTNALTSSTQGTTTVTWTFDDGNGNTSTQTQNIVVDDITAPVTPTLSAITIDCNGTLSIPSTTDNCAGTINGTTSDTLNYVEGSSTTVTWTFDDGNGNSTTATQVYNYEDNTNPTITAPADVTVDANASCEATGVMLGTPTIA
ncbi:M14 family zinc carboxypeptidase, partial [Winogradskyella haliclonae]|uniref:M14 family zinc carboxypeptidase n=1 Tax=Winogradskyella haliclonae TaxID=2048558 RepID=UPI00166BA076